MRETTAKNCNNSAHNKEIAAKILHPDLDYSLEPENECRRMWPSTHPESFHSLRKQESRVRQWRVTNISIGTSLNPFVLNTFNSPTSTVPSAHQAKDWNVSRNTSKGNRKVPSKLYANSEELIRDKKPRHPSCVTKSTEQEKQQSKTMLPINPHLKMSMKPSGKRLSLIKIFCPNFKIHKRPQFRSSELNNKKQSGRLAKANHIYVCTCEAWNPSSKRKYNSKTPERPSKEKLCWRFMLNHRTRPMFTQSEMSWAE